MNSIDKEGFERRIQSNPAFDKRRPDPNKNYGAGPVRLWFLFGKDGMWVQFMMDTGWRLPHIMPGPIAGDDHYLCRPRGRDLGCHSPYPMYEGQKKMGECDLIEGGCYYDGSSLNAERVMDRLLREGFDGVWAELHDYWHSRFADAAEGVAARKENK